MKYSTSTLYIYLYVSFYINYMTMTMSACITLCQGTALVTDTLNVQFHHELHIIYLSTYLPCTWGLVPRPDSHVI